MVTSPMLTLIVKTVDRSPRKNFLEETFKNFERAGGFASGLLARPIFLVDSGSLSLDFMSGVIELAEPGAFIVDSAKRTMHENAARCLQLAGEARTKWALVIEDDLDFCGAFVESAVAWLEEHETEGPMLYALGANYAQIDSMVGRGLTRWHYPVHAFYGAQACAWRADVAAQLAAWLGPSPTYNGNTMHGHDLLLQHWGKELKLPYFLASAPSFVQHIGNESSIGNRFFSFASWPGRSWRYTPKG